MMHSYIFSSDRCTLFQNMAGEVWRKIIHAHDVGMNVPEIGITTDIIINILQYSKYHRQNFEVFARNSWNENQYGSDIDLYVETTPGSYVWFALQAKVLKTNKRYTTLRDGYHAKNNPYYQWDKLMILEGATGCKSYYLFYNGVDYYNHNGIDCCKHAFRQDQFGCSIVRPIDVQTIALRTRANGDFISPKFTDFHNNLAQPWRTLVCCQHDLSKFTLYSYSEIIESNPNLKKIEYDKMQIIKDDSDENGDENSKDSNEYIPFVDGNRINKGCIEAKWNPEIRIIVRHSDIKFEKE